MPRMQDIDMEQFGAVGATTYGWTGVKIGELGASEYTLVSLVIDRSGSVGAYADTMERAIREHLLPALEKCPRKDSLLIRTLAFNQELEEIHGFRLFAQCKPSEYQDFLRPSGMTALHIAACNGLDATYHYAEHLKSQDFQANAIVIFFTDGENNIDGPVNAHTVAESLKSAVQAEHLESINTILVGLNMSDSGTSQALEAFQKHAAMDKYICIKNTSEKAFAELMDYVSQSIGSQSQALGSGGPSQLLNF